ncbi:hypothetical protein RhiirA1_481398, partial [Rhizophagus irregularis]
MENEKKGVSRRDFMKTTGIATGTLVGGGIIGGLIGYNVNRDTVTDETTGNPRSPNQYDLGPGAIGLGVPYFIDNQLAGSYGMNAKEYMQGPFEDGATTQGYQSRLTRAEIFSQGIAKLDEEAFSRFDKSFSEIEPEQMDEILTAFQKGEVPMQAVTSDFFFKLLRQATLEGAYADPIYNGNRNMEGWKMKGFPGHQFSYIGQIESEEFVEIEPKSISNKVDVVTVGVGWTGGIVAAECSKAGLKVRGLERGAERGTKDYGMVHDEFRYAIRYELFQDLSKESITFRNNREMKALPMRMMGSFLLGEGLGGSGTHWNGQNWRFLPYDFEIKSMTDEKY